MIVLASCFVVLRVSADPSTSYPEKIGGKSAEVSPAPVENEVSEPKQTGKNAAAKYFSPDKKRSAASDSSISRPIQSDHYLAIHLGSYMTSQSYLLASNSEADIGKFNGGISYRFGEWTNSGDFLLRLDLDSLETAAGKRATKMGILAAVSFPDATSGFPFYFGGGIGPGVFFKQLDSESAITLEYQIFLGLRFMNVIESTGFFIEAGLKNFVNVLSDGQHNGSTFGGGAVFTF